MTLKHITFTGIDSRTDINVLRDIQKAYPIAEFGVLTSYHWNENGNRYLNPELIQNLVPQYDEVPLNLSLHICGSAAVDAAYGEWNRINNLVNDNLELFKRCQLNVAERLDNPEYVSIPFGPKQEVIVQQKNANEIDLFKNTFEFWTLLEKHFSVLLDASGGRGIEGNIEVLHDYPKVGYAGGITPDNVANKLSYLLEQDIDCEFWIDMESGVRTDDWFDTEKVVNVLETYQYINANLKWLNQF